MENKELIEKVLTEAKNNPEFEKELLNALNHIPIITNGEALKAADNIATVHGITLSDEEKREDYVFMVAAKFMKYVSDRIGMCYFSQNGKWEELVLGNISEICSRTDEKDVEKINLYIKRNFPNFEQKVNIFDIYDYFKRL